MICSGIYVWGFALEQPPFQKPTNKFFPYYVGKANNIFCRLYEHLTALKGGAYPIFDVQYCAQNKLNIGAMKKAYECQIKQNRRRHIAHPKLPKEIIYFPEGANTFLDFYSSRQIQNTVNWMVEHFVFRYIQLPAHVNKAYAESFVTTLLENAVVSGGRALVPKDFAAENIGLPTQIEDVISDSLCE